MRRSSSSSGWQGKTAEGPGEDNHRIKELTCRSHANKLKQCRQEVHLHQSDQMVDDKHGFIVEPTIGERKKLVQKARRIHQTKSL
jgi:hypothetical protein